MFENVLGQSAADQLIQDIKAGVLAPAMLFSGPPASGKGTAALELGRVISCEAVPPETGGIAPDGGRALWNCACPACARHRLLSHPDLLCLGRRPFSAEIAASAGVFQQNAGSAPARLFFIRSIRKLLARFNPLLWEDDPKAGKIAPLVNTLEEDLDELELLTSPAETPPLLNKDALRKLCDALLKNAFKLESEGVSETIPIAQLRRAAWWCRLAPSGRGKLLVIENADRMQEEGRNSLLKLLEEPPARVTLVLTTPRPGSLLSTMLSRLRPYRFAARSAEVEREVIRRVFRHHAAPEPAAGGASPNAGESGIGAYLDSFLPVSGEILEALAAFFAASAAFKAALLSKKQGRPLPEEVVLLGKYTAPKAEAAGLGRPQGNCAAVVSLVMEKADKFEIRSLFSGFLSSLLDMVSKSQMSFLPSLPYNELWRKTSSWAESAVLVYKLKPAHALEKFFIDLSRGMAEL